MSLRDFLSRVFGSTTKSLGLGAEQPNTPLPPALDREKFIYVKLPESLGPIDRGSKYEDPLDQRLRAAGIGEVSGGGSQLGDKNPDGSRDIKFCGVDVDVTDLGQALELLRDTLPLLGAADGTELHYTWRETKLQDVLRNGVWELEQPRVSLHPGFGW